MSKGVHLRVAFYRTGAGREPVREWLQRFEKPDKRTLGIDIKTVQYGWPLGMPLVRKLAAGLWEMRSCTQQGIARILFTVVENDIVLLHGFIKKSRKTPFSDLEVAKRRKLSLEN